jgi:hypothetical protein
MCLDVSEDRLSSPPRQPQIDEHEIECVPGEESVGLGAVARTGDVAPLASQDRSKKIANTRLGVRHEDPLTG